MDTKPEYLQGVGPPGRMPLPLEKRLASDLGAALDEASKYFRGESDVHQTLRRVCRRLEELSIPYAVAGGLAVTAHGLRRVTEDVDIVVDREGLRRIHSELEGLGYVRLFKGSKNLRDVQTGVRVEFLITGGFPGDGRPKPVSFPAPDSVAEAHDGIKYINLPTLIELKLASGISNKNRIKDISDVQELIKVVGLPKEIATQLNPYVRDKYVELWSGVHEGKTRFVRQWTRTTESESQLATMRDEGVQVEPLTGDQVRLVSTDPDLARKYDMHEESEFFPPESDASA